MTAKENCQTNLKVVLVGNSTVGKTCLVRFAVTDTFNDDITPTIGAAYSVKFVTHGSHAYRLQIWDTAGQEKFRGITPMYYHNADVALVVYSVADSASFEAIDYWMSSLKEHGEKDLVVFLVGNQIDRKEDRLIETGEGARKAKEIAAEFSEVSAKTGQGVRELFSSIPLIYSEKSLNRQNPVQAKKISVVEQTAPPAKTNCC